MPLSFSGEAFMENDLNDFTWKFIFVYYDHLAVFKAPN